MQIDWPAEFDTWFDNLEDRADKGDRHAQQVRSLVTAMLKRLQRLERAPDHDAETGVLRWVRQSKRYPLWRVSHPYRAGIAVRLICWFPPDTDTAVVALFAGDKARIGDVFYNSVGARADGLIDQWKRETARRRS